MNTFTKPVATKFPIISEVMNNLKILGADFVQMSGSGSTVFGVFSDFNLGENAYTNLKKRWNKSFCLIPSFSKVQDL
jgi:4-diphosphocytidyl-2-C-methyl-D-erythritol kinase